MIQRLLVIVLVSFLLCLCLVSVKASCPWTEKTLPIPHKPLPTTYCISLKEAWDRRQSMLRRFSIYGLHVRFMDAIDTRGSLWRSYRHRMTPDAVRGLEQSLQRRRRESHNMLAPGAVGCFLSHFRCWEICRTAHPNETIFLILEDDSFALPSFSTEFAKVLKSIPPDADMILLSFLTNGKHVKKTVPYLSLYRLRQPDGRFLLNDAYLITRQGIDHITQCFIDQGFQLDQQLDWYLSDLSGRGKIVIYHTQHVLCLQDGRFATSIQTLPCHRPLF